MAGKRQSNIELLRILAAMAVIILHFNNKEIGGALKLVPFFSNKSRVLYMLESLDLCAVNLFLLIFGYFQSSKSQISLKKPLFLLLQVSVFQILSYMIPSLIRGEALAAQRIWLNLIPANYFAVTYVAVYLLSPYINTILNTIEQNAIKKLILICCVLFCLWPTVAEIIALISGYRDFINVSVFISNKGHVNGYSLPNYLFMYLIGAVCFRMKDKISLFRKKHLMLVLIASVFLEYCLLRYSESHALTSSFLYGYNNPLIILIAVAVFSLFHNWDIGYHPVINTLAKASFTVYLSHRAFFPFMQIQKFTQLSGPVFILYIIFLCIFLYLAGTLLSYLYNLITAPLAKAGDKCGLLNKTIP